MVLIDYLILIYLVLWFFTLLRAIFDAKTAKIETELSAIYLCEVMLTLSRRFARFETVNDETFRSELMFSPWTVRTKLFFL